jgi:isopenicillin-N epimerase
MPDALMFAEDYGLDRIMAHNSGLARMGAMLFQRLGAEPMAGETHFAAMWSLRLPTRDPAEPAHAVQLLNEMWDRHRVQIAASAVHGRLLLRLSAQIYCTLDDFARAAEALDHLGWPGRV